MRVISKKALKDFAEIHPDALSSLEDWNTRVLAADWHSSVDVLKDFPTTSDRVGTCHVFNIAWNKYRLIAVIHYPRMGKSGNTTEGRVYVRHILTHREYDKDAWKKECGC